MRTWAVICLVVCLGSLSFAQSGNPSNTILLGSTNSPGGYMLESGYSWAQEFVLSDEVKTTSVTFTLGGSWRDSGIGEDVVFLAQLTRGIGPGSVVLSEQEFTFKASPTSLYATTFEMPAHLKLTSGTYYLVLSTKSDVASGSLTWSPGPSGITTTQGHLGDVYRSTATGYEKPNEAPDWVHPNWLSQKMLLQVFGRSK